MKNKQSSVVRDGGDRWQQLVAHARAERREIAAADAASADDFSQRVVARWRQESTSHSANSGQGQTLRFDRATMWEATGLRGLAAAAALAVAALCWSFLPDATADAITNEIVSFDPLSGFVLDR